MPPNEPTYIKMRSADAITLGVYIAFGFFIFSIPFACLLFFIGSIFGNL